MKETFFITTPIYYVNDKPHIGHAYTTILADVIARFYRSIGRNTFFLTGLDEHGQKVQLAAEKNGTNPIQHCNDIAPRFTQLWEKLHISNDDFNENYENLNFSCVSFLTNPNSSSIIRFNYKFLGIFQIINFFFVILIFC